MIITRGSAPAISCENKIYVFGGCGENIGMSLDTAEVYDRQDQKWIMLPPIPRARSAPILVKIKEKIALIGGYTHKGVPVQEVDVFDTNTQAWELFPPLKTTKTMYPIVIAVENSLYMFGGSNHKGDAVKDCFVLENCEGDWKELAPLSVCRYAGKAFHTNNKIIVVGGRSGKEAVRSTDIYDIKSASWSLKGASRTIPSNRIFSNSIQHKDHIYLLNGLVPPVHFQTVAEKYDPEKEKWEKMTPAPFARADTSLAMIKDFIVVIGGMCEHGPNRVTEAYDTNTDTWFTLAQMPSPRFSTSVVVFDDNTLVCLGGIGLCGATDDVEALTFED
ncbi:kelch domain-containing protein 8A-like [Hydractinia symbiolongicarpus]|uniref:kelch domain-containing protein 8A-like n=1 Tax=Hydractinia symbiolongicarpus TaxID=13093 RepID=UPI00254B5F1B|nr:kelch domain-containing protein 8A-like [Hydractinia symbiolongicarpus]